MNEYFAALFKGSTYQHKFMTHAELPIHLGLDDCFAFVTGPPVGLKLHMGLPIDAFLLHFITKLSRKPCDIRWFWPILQS